MDLLHIIQTLNGHLAFQAKKSKIHGVRENGMADARIQANFSMEVKVVSHRVGNYHGAYGPQQGAVSYTSGGAIKYRNKGVRKAIQAEKRREADIRNARTPLDRRRAYREGRMNVTPEVAKEVLTTKRKKVKK